MTDRICSSQTAYKSEVEEIIAALWIIAALLAFGFGYTVFGVFFSTKGVLDLLCAAQYARRDQKR